MAQSLEVNIKTTSDVPQATEKAKAAVTGFDKQLQDIGKKFSTSFKDIFLSMVGPMAIFSALLQYVGKVIADNQKRHADANQAAIDGTNELMSVEDRYYQNKRKNEKDTAQKVVQAKTTREDVTRDFLENDPRASILQGQELSRGTLSTRRINLKLSKNKEVQDRVQAMIAEDAKNNPPPAASNAPTSFKTPEGFGNVVGVGANPVIEAMTMQLQEAKKQTALLETISRGNGGGVPTDFTKSPIPSRASMLQGAK
jgi:hypothetical protein